MTATPTVKAGEPIRIAFLARSLEATGGAEQQLAYIALGLNPERFQIRVFCFYETGELCRRIRAGGIPIRSLLKRSRWDLVGPVLRLRKELATFQPHVLHSFLGPPNVLSALLKPTIPGTRVIWGIRASDMRLENYDWTRRASFMAEILLSRVPDAIVANADSGREYVRSAGFSTRRLEVVPNGIDISRFTPNKEAGQRIRATLGIPLDAKVIGSVARIDPQKDLPTFLRAAARAARERPDLVFVCVGNGPDALQQELRTLTADLGVSDRVHWLGKRKDVPDLLNAIDLFTLTSAYGEGFPNVVGEAMASGSPCITTDVGDCAAIIGDTGYVVPRGDDAALAQRWLSFLALPTADRQDMGRRARLRIEKNFSLNAMLQHSEQLYNNLTAVRHSFPGAA